MKVRLHPRFGKLFKKMRPQVREKFKERLRIFQREPHHPLLNNHSLQGKYDGCRSINVTGDYRAIFKMETFDTALFFEIGTHNELYR